MDKQFRELEESFENLRNKFKSGDISRQDYIERLKKLRLKDSEGRFWMIGAQSGKWYYYDGKEWIQSEPPSIKEGKAMCIYCGFENKITAEVCARCGGNIRGEVASVCPKCGYELKDPTQDCPRCSEEVEDTDEHQEEISKEKENYPLVFHSINPVSFFVFWGFIGLVIGIVCGAFAGASDFFSSLTKILPSFLQSLQGKLFGGIIFAGLGGVAGFIALGILGFITALFINVVSSIVGGVKLRFSR